MHTKNENGNINETNRKESNSYPAYNLKNRYNH